jgi:hypothetical protein
MVQIRRAAGALVGAMAMSEQRPRCGLSTGSVPSVYLAILFLAFLSATSSCLAEQPAPLTVERPPTQKVELTEGFSTTIHSERPLGKVAITDPEVVDLVLRTDKSAVLIPQRPGRTNIDFLDDHGALIGRIDVSVVRQSTQDRIVIYNRPSLGAYSTFHCGYNGCEHFEEVPNKEEALTPGLPQERGPNGMPPQ